METTLRGWIELIARRPCESEIRDRYRLIEEKCPSCIANHALMQHAAAISAAEPASPEDCRGE